MEQLLLDLVHAPAPTFSNFAGGRNLESLVAVRDWAEGQSRERCVYLWGSPGSGRTHLLRAAVGAVALRGHRARYMSAEAELLEVETAGATERWLAIDDIDQLHAFGQHVLFGLLNEAADAQTHLLLAGGAGPAMLDIRADARTRVASGLVFQLHPPSDEEMIQVLRGQARQRGFELPDEGASHLLQRARRDLPSLLAILDAADAFSLRAKRPVTLALLRQIVDEANATRRS